MKLAKDKTYLIDLDGTMYRGNQVIPEALVFFDALQKHQINYVFVTNNAMRTPFQIKAKMEAMGYHNIKETDFFTSAMAAASYMYRHSDQRKAFCIGEEGLKEALRQVGFQLVDDHAQLVFVGLQRDATYSLYCKAFQMLQQEDAILIGTNGDRRLPENDTYVIGNGAVVEMLKYALQKEPLMIGKPSHLMMEETLRFVHKEKQECIVIGDNLETDIAFASQNGVESIMVCSGVHQKKDLDHFTFAPTHIIESLLECEFQ